MKMTSRKLADLLKQRLQDENRSFFFDREKDTLRVEDQTTKKGITLELPPIIAKWETKKKKRSTKSSTMCQKQWRRWKAPDRRCPERKPESIRSSAPHHFPIKRATAFRSCMMTIRPKRESTTRLTSARRTA